MCYIFTCGVFHADLFKKLQFLGIDRKVVGFKIEHKCLTV